MDYSKLGARERPKDERDFLLGAIQHPVSIPSSFLPDNSWLVRHFQGLLPTCGAHASSHFKALLDKAERPDLGTSPNYSPRFSWIKIKQVDGFPLDAGTDMRSIFKSQQNDGMDDFEPLGDDASLPLAQYSDSTAITAEMVANANPKTIGSYAFGNTDYESLCQHIFQNAAILLLIKCDDGFWGTTNPTFTTPKYGHFVVADGYDEDGIRIIDSADATDGVKHIAKQYITPQFVIESGTALDIPPNTVPTLPPLPKNIQPTPQNVSLLQKIIQLYKAILNLITPKVAVGTTTMQSSSPKFSINGVDIQKVLTGLCVGLAGVAITVLTMLSGATYHVLLGTTDLTPIATALAAALFSTIVNILRKYITDNSNASTTSV